MANKFDLEFLRQQAEINKEKNNGFADKFKTKAEIVENQKNKIEIIPTDRLEAYSKHPFKLRDDERLTELMDSIAEQGILIPLIVRIHPTKEAWYEVLAGHHRLEAAKRLNIEHIPCVIKNVDDNMAALIVVESNKQRGFADMLPSEIAYALKLEYEALKCQGKRTDLERELEEILTAEFDENNSVESTEKSLNDGQNLTSGPLVQKLNSDEKLSNRTVRRYIRLTELIAPLLELVDDGDIAIRPAVSLSYLKQAEQEVVSDVLSTNNYKVDIKKAEQLKEDSKKGKINEDRVMLILSGAIFEQKPKKVTSVKLPLKKIKEYVDTSLTADEMEEYIITALEFYKNNSKGEI